MSWLVRCYPFNARIMLYRRWHCLCSFESINIGGISPRRLHLSTFEFALGLSVPVLQPLLGGYTFCCCWKALEVTSKPFTTCSQGD